MGPAFAGDQHGIDLGIAYGRLGILEERRAVFVGERASRRGVDIDHCAKVRPGMGGDVGRVDRADQARPEKTKCHHGPLLPRICRYARYSARSPAASVINWFGERSDEAGAMDIDVETAVRELTEGCGYVVFPGFFPDDTVAEARSLLWALAEAEDSEPESTTDPAAAAPSLRNAVPTQKRVWNLIERGSVFRDIAEEPRMLAVLETVLGHDFVLGSIAGSVLRPGAPRQEAHVDYPYWDLYDPARFPLGFNTSFHIEVETLVMLDEFTAENGATAILPGSHKRCAWPDAEEFERDHVQATGPAGSLLMFTAPIWHAGRANRSDAPRTALLSAYHCKFIRQLEDFRRSVSPETLDQCSERLRYLMGIDLPYPTLMSKNRRPMPISRKDRAVDGTLPEYAVQAEARR